MPNYQRESEAMRCLVQLSFLAPGATLAAAELAQRESLAVAHVTRMMVLLGQSGLVQGDAQGYRLARAAERIGLADVRFALEANSNPAHKPLGAFGPTVAGIAAAEDAAFEDPRAAQAS